jgi:hypothetical protein
MGPNLEMKNLEICIIIIVSNNYMIRVISLYTSEQCIVDIWNYSLLMTMFTKIQYVKSILMQLILKDTDYSY